MEIYSRALGSCKHYDRNNKDRPCLDGRLNGIAAVLFLAQPDRLQLEMFGALFMANGQESLRPAKRNRAWLVGTCGLVGVLAPLQSRSQNKHQQSGKGDDHASGHERHRRSFRRISECHCGPHVMDKLEIARLSALMSSPHQLLRMQIRSTTGAGPLSSAADPAR